MSGEESMSTAVIARWYKLFTMWDEQEVTLAKVCGFFGCGRKRVRASGVDCQPLQNILILWKTKSSKSRLMDSRVALRVFTWDGTLKMSSLFCQDTVRYCVLPLPVIHVTTTLLYSFVLPECNLMTVDFVQQCITSTHPCAWQPFSLCAASPTAFPSRSSISS